MTGLILQRNNILYRKDNSLIYRYKNTDYNGVDTTGMDQAAYRKAAVDAVRQLSVDVGIPTKLPAIKEEDLQFLAESAYADACAPGNPKEASVEDMKALIRQLM